MKVAVTGARGYLGARVAAALLAPRCELGAVSELVLVDAAGAPPGPAPDARVRWLALDLTTPSAAEQVVTPDLAVLFHLAAVVSGEAEADFDLGMRVNLDATRALLEAARRRAPGLRLVFTSSVAVFGGELPRPADDRAAPAPETSYGAAKAMCELLVADYSRRGWVDGRSVRLPTVSVRAGAANRAVTSFASAMVREPLAGREAACPVPAEQRLWLTGPATVVRNIVHAAALPAPAAGRAWRPVSLPGLSVAARDILEALRAVAGERVAARVRYALDAQVARMVASFPDEFDNTRALGLGFVVDSNFEDIVRAYIRDDLKGSIQ